MEPSKEHEHDSSHNPQTILHWKAPIRAYKKQGAHIIRFYLALALLLSLLVIFFGDSLLLIPIWAVLFLFYVLTVTPAPEIEHKVTKFGLESADITIRWEVLSHFYFSKRFDYIILTVVSHPPFNTHLYFVIPSEELKQKLISILSEHLVYKEKPNRTFTEKATDWLAKLVPDDHDSHHTEARA